MTPVMGKLCCSTHGIQTTNPLTSSQACCIKLQVLHRLFEYDMNVVLQYKAEGNAAIKAQRWSEADAAYTHALLLSEQLQNPSQLHILYSNR